GSECGAGEWAWPGYGGKMVPEHDPAVCWNEIAPVVMPLRRCCSGGIHRQHPRRDPGGVETISEEVDADGSCYDPESVDRLVPMQGDDSQGAGPYPCEDDPRDCSQHFVNSPSSQQMGQCAPIARQNPVPVAVAAATDNLRSRAPHTVNQLPPAREYPAVENGVFPALQELRSLHIQAHNVQRRPLSQP